MPRMPLMPLMPTMRRTILVLLSALPMLADAPKPMKVPMTARLESVGVLFGPGIIQDRTGETPAPKFETKLDGSIHLEGIRPNTTPHYRFWLVNARATDKLNSRSARSLGGKALEFTVRANSADGMQFVINWPKGSVEEQDRLFVEIMVGRRRTATAISAIQSHYLPASKPQGGDSKD